MLKVSYLANKWYYGTWGQGPSVKMLWFWVTLRAKGDKDQGFMVAIKLIKMILWSPGPGRPEGLFRLGESIVPTALEGPHKYWEPTRYNYIEVVRLATSAHVFVPLLLNHHLLFPCHILWLFSMGRVAQVSPVELMIHRVGHGAPQKPKRPHYTNRSVIRVQSLQADGPRS